MSKCENNGKIETIETVQVPMEIDEPDQNGIAVAVARDHESPPAIFKLHAIACEDLFEYLSLKDIYSIGMTCKRMNRLAGLYFKENLHNMVTRVKENGIIFRSNEELMDLSGFSEFVETVRFDGREIKSFQYVESNCASVKKVIINNALGGTKVNTSIMDNLKLVKIRDYVCANDEIISDLLKLCKNVQSLQLYVKHLPNNWYHQRYPLLEHFELFFDGKSDKVDEVKIFLEQNPSIRCLEISAKYLFKNRHSILKTNVTLDELSIASLNPKNLETIALLNELYHRNFYKRLKLRLLFVHQNDADLMAKLPAVETINFGGTVENIVWPAIVNLKVVELHEWQGFDFETLVKNNVTIERVHIGETTFNEIQLMMRHLPNLKELIICYIAHEKELDISALNKVRETLFGARKVIIYLVEETFLLTKWMFSPREFNLVEIRRIESLPMKPKLMSLDEN